MTKKYEPSNSSEGMWFCDKFCEKCTKWPDDPDDPDQCDIARRSFSFHIDEPEYPDEWIYDEDEKPVCTAFDARIKDVNNLR